MGPANCAVVGCHNCTQYLQKWKESSCHLHENVLHKDCSCEAPFRLYMFPSIKRFSHKRTIWINLLKREKQNKKEWEPRPSDRVCSEHFVDPNPTLKLGYDKREETPRRKLFRQPYVKPQKKASCTLTSTRQTSPSSTALVDLQSPLSAKNTYPPDFTTPYSSMYTDAPYRDIASPASSDHCYSAVTERKCDACTYKDTLIKSYITKVSHLTRKVRLLRMQNRKKAKKIKPLSWSNIKSDKKMNFYTGLSSILLFNALFSLIEPFLKKITYWRGTKHSKTISSKLSKRTFSPSSQKKLSPKDELFLTLMRLRLGLLNEDLADRFNISPASCSNTFKTWIRFLNDTLGKALVCWLPKESILENMPKVYRKAGHNKLRVIIDCSEVFIERAKALDTQAATWSDYKSHNTFKFLIGISPTGFITFLSDCYGGRASDKFICADSEFYDCLEAYDEVMADRDIK